MSGSPARRPYERTVKRAIVLTLFLLLTTSCSGGSQEAKDTLVNAAERSTSADSFHVEWVISDPNGRHIGELDYVAPDRYRMRGFGKA